MKILFYFADCHRRSDYEAVPDNPYHQELLSIAAESGRKLQYFSNYYTEYCSTYKWLLSVFNGRSSIEHGEFTWSKNPPTEFLNSNKFLLYSMLEMLGYSTCTSEIKIPRKRQDYWNTLPDLGRMFSRVGNFSTREDLLYGSTPENSFDLVYDLVFHDLIYNYPDTDEGLAPCFEQSFKSSKELFNKELFSKYDKVIFVSDHGYSSTVDGKQVQHEFDGTKLGLGSPLHHSNPILYILHNDLHGNYEYRDNLINQVDLFNEIQSLITSGTTMLQMINRPFVITQGYYSAVKEYPKVFHIVTKYGFISFDFTNESGEHDTKCISREYLWSTKEYSDHTINKMDWDILFQGVPTMDKLFSYKEF